MPRKFKIVWIVCCFIIFMGFAYVAVKDQMLFADAKKSEMRQRDKEEKKQAQKVLSKKIASNENLKPLAELSSLGKYEEAEAEAKKVLQEFPDSAEAYTWLGIVAVKKGQKSEALEYFLKSSELEPGKTQNLIYWGLTLAMLGRYEEALPKYAAAVKIDPLNSNALAYWGASLSQLRQYPEATLKLEEAVALNKFNEAAYGNLVDVLYLSGEYQRAWKTVARARRNKIEIQGNSLSRLRDAMPEPDPE